MLFRSFLFWAWRKALVIRLAFEKQQEQSQKAIEQINSIATVSFPALQQVIMDLSKKSEEEKSELKELSTGLAVLLDRGQK